MQSFVTRIGGGLCAAVLGLATPVHSNDTNVMALRGLGQSYTLENIDVLGSLGQGINVLTGLKEACYDVDNLDANRKRVTFYSDTTTFAKYIRAEAGLSGEAKDRTGKAVKATLNTLYVGADYKTSHITGSSLDVYIYDSLHTINPNCMTPSHIDPAFLAEYRKLPSFVTSPHLASSWEAYESFLTTYGSHIMTGAYLGSRLQQWAVATSSENFSAKDFGIRTCAEVEGPTGGGYAASGCAAYSEAEMRRALSLNMETNLYILGGTAATRAKMTAGTVTPELLETFLSEAIHSDEPARYTWKPIWDVLGQFSTTSEDKLRAHNMRAYYNGFSGFGCPQIVGNGNVLLQRFYNSNGGNPKASPTFECQVRATGCQTDDDCHIGGAIASQCYCYGNTCITQTTPPGGRLKALQQLAKTGGTDDGVNQTCHYQFGAFCDCKPTSEPFQAIWE